MGILGGKSDVLLNKYRITKNNYVLTIANLEWCSASENSQHAYDLGLQKARPSYGEKHGQSKLNKEQVIEIRKLYEEGYRLYQLAKLFPVCRQTIDSIVKYKTWREV